MIIKTDSRKINKGDIFVSLDSLSGNNYIMDAIKNGASKVINKDYNCLITNVEDTREYLINYLKENNKDLFDDMKLIGITGTNGKTTSSFLIYQLLNMFNIKCAYIGTLGFYLEDKIKPLLNTTPDILDLYEMFIECKDKNIKVIVMEVSSQAIAHKRIEGLEFDIGIFTNLTLDHLDYHKTMENYKNCKKELFKKLKNDKIVIINKDDKYYKDFMLEYNNNILYGIDGDYKIIDYELYVDYTQFNFEYKNKKYNVLINLPGKYNIYNYMTSLITCNILGLNIEEIITKSIDLKPPNGRYDIVKYDKKLIIIDYAHTPDAVLNIISNVNEYKKGKIITIIGCGGNRDSIKRPIMGDIVTKNSDYVIFTNDNPRLENEMKIMNDIITNLLKNNYEIIYNREEAIEKGIGLLKENDILLILGKGHENYQLIGGKKYHFSDKDVVLKIINYSIKK